MKDQLWWVPGEQSVNPVSQIKPSGAVIVDGQHVADTVQCVHCGMHWIPVKGSKKIRGFCQKCNGRHCGKVECWECMPFKKKF